MSQKSSVPQAASCVLQALKRDNHDPLAPWQSEGWLAEMRRSLRPAQYLRMIENRFVATETSFIDMSWWDACVHPDARPVQVEPTLHVWVGVDASVKRDSTAIVAVSWDKKYQHARLVWHRIYQPSAEDPMDFERIIEATLLDLKKTFACAKSGTTLIRCTRPPSG
jgi:hypothetical protein